MSKKGVKPKNFEVVQQLAWKANTGRVASKETREKMSQTRKGLLVGRKATQETKDKLSAARKRFYENGGVHPKGMSGKKMGESTRRKMSESHKGELGSGWKGGVTPENARIRRNIDYRLWREAVFARDNWTCVSCEKRGCILNADHIKPFALFPELRFAIDNGRTLCVPCHREVTVQQHKDGLFVRLQPQKA